MKTQPTPPKPAAATPPRPRKRFQKTCADCYFGARDLCALGLDEPCSTFRANSPEGLMPPSQPTLLVGSESAGESLLAEAV